MLLNETFTGNKGSWRWDKLGLPVLSLLAGPMQHFRAAVLDGWRDRVSAELCGRKRVWVWTSS